MNLSLIRFGVLASLGSALATTGYLSVRPLTSWQALSAALAGLLTLTALGHARRRTELSDHLRVERQLRSAAERKLTDAGIMLNRLVAQQEQIKAYERHRIARDIHDDLGQHLLALKIDLTLLHGSTSGVLPQIHQKLGLVSNNLDRTIGSLRTIINDLRPSCLEEGLRAAMTWQLDEFARLGAATYQLEADASAFDDSHDGALDALILRILQEALSNVLRHAQASHVHVRFTRDRTRITLTVQDDGIGMPQQAVPCGCGLTGMRARVAAHGGTFALHSTAGAGTRLALALPLACAVVPAQ